MVESRHRASGRFYANTTLVPDGSLRVTLLGRFEVSAGTRVIREDEWRLRKAASVVKLLALAPDHGLHREQVMHLLWPDLGARAAANNLHQALHVARRTIEPEASTHRFLPMRGEQLTLCQEGSAWVDVNAFERTVREARGSGRPTAYRAAIDLYSGDLLPLDRYEEWAERRREELRRTYLAMLFELASVLEERGALDRAVEMLQEIVAHEPVHEEAHVGLMRAYAKAGQRHRALRQYEHLRQALRSELGTEPHAASRYVYGEVLAGHVPVPSAIGREQPREIVRHNLSGSLTSFVGREREREEVERLLGTTRLLTLTGAGGSGKTRLAQEVARDLTDAYPDGVWFVELAPLTHGSLVKGAVSETLDVREQPGRPPDDFLVEALREKCLLLVLDNCEHLVDEVARLAEMLLSSCQGLRILATSREILGSPGEVSWQVPPLSGPDPAHRDTAETLEGYESVRLFVQRARYRNPAFILTPQNAAGVAEICGRLEGLPLAIELAAARVGFSVQEIAARLDDSLRLLTAGSRTASPRQRTLRGALDWSHDLLSEPERVLFRRLSAFAGGWTLEAAEVVGCGDGIERGDVLDLLSGLVDKSLVLAEATGDGAVRYRLLEPVRQYAGELLRESGEAETVRHNHARWCLDFVEGAREGLEGPEQASWVERLKKEHANAQAALSWSLDDEPETSLRLVATLGYFWYRYGRILEGRRWLEEVLERTGDVETVTRAKTLRLAGVLSEESGLYEQAEKLHEQGLALYRRLENRDGVAAALTSLGALAYAVGDLERAVSLTQESLALKRELGDEKALMSSRNNLGEMMQSAGDLAKAQALFEENLESDEILGDEWGAAVSRLNLGTLAVEQGEPVRAEKLLTEALRAFQRLGDEDATTDCLDSLAAAAGARGEGLRAATLFGTAEATREELGTPIRPVDRERYERFVAAARSGVGERAWASAWSAGRAMSLQEAAAYACAPESTPPPATDEIATAGAMSERPSTSLTPREREVALLVARGFTNRRISEELSISERTVATHVARSLKKLELGSRSGLAAWITEQSPPDPD
ncbi:MAG TPA: BTAD domain-containing putative transcriptional regulator [Rubrobacter sp.]|nr:BTAD domain-containing putative transcriptional regulator [Rubrobacter sp.]